MSVDKNLFIDAWPEWDIQRELGRGSYGIVYEAVNRSSGAELKAAIKMIRIPRDRSVIDQYRKKGMDDDAINEEIMEMVNKVITEMKVMEKLKDSPNIVSIEDFKVADNKDGFGKTIFITARVFFILKTAALCTEASVEERQTETALCVIHQDVLSILAVTAQTCTTVPEDFTAMTEDMLRVDSQTASLPVYSTNTMLQAILFTAVNGPICRETARALNTGRVRSCTREIS